MTRADVKADAVYSVSSLRASADAAADEPSSDLRSEPADDFVRAFKSARLAVRTPRKQIRQQPPLALCRKEGKKRHDSDACWNDEAQQNPQ